MDFKSYLKITAQEINLELDKFLKGWNGEVEKISPKLVSLNKQFINGCDGGKRLRGALVKLGYEIARSKDHLGGVPSTSLRATIRGDLLQNDESKEILKPAVAFEIFQTAILAHDDIIDLSPLRRGKPTIYQALGGDHYGISQTICLGDIGFFLSQKLIAESNFPQERKVKALASFADTFVKTGLGEMLDVEIPHKNEGALEEDVLTIFKLKTAKYTISGPMQLGAILGGGSDQLLGKLGKFGESLGIAFQMQDDILGVFGSAEQTGKSITSDIEEGKVTLLILKALANASSKQKKILNKYYGKGKIGVREVGEIRDIFIKTGALEYSNKKAEELVADAKKIIPQLTIRLHS